jgi:hypothetical protein
LNVKSVNAGSKAHRVNRARRLAYRAYGLAIVSDVEIPELTPLRDLRDMGRNRVNLGIHGSPRVIEEPAQWLNVAANGAGAPWLSTAKIDGGYLLRFPKLADFVIDATGHNIACTGAADLVNVVTLRHLAIDHVMPRVLNLLGIDSLHATAVASPVGAIAFVGDTGSGKSTLSASFHLAGFESFCDDCLVLREESGRIMATPAYPGVRLWDDSFKALMSDADPGAPVAQYTRKTRLLGDASGFRADTLPLARIYLLQRPAEKSAEAVTPAIAQVSPAEAFPLLVGASFPLDLTDTAMLTRHFHFINRVAATVPIRRLTIPTDFAALPAVRAAVIADLDAP